MAEKNGVAQDDHIQTWGGGSTLEESCGQEEA